MTLFTTALTNDLRFVPLYRFQKLGLHFKHNTSISRSQSLPVRDIVTQELPLLREIVMHKPFRDDVTKDQKKEIQKCLHFCFLQD